MVNLKTLLEIKASEQQQRRQKCVFCLWASLRKKLLLGKILFCVWKRCESKQSRLVNCQQLVAFIAVQLLFIEEKRDKSGWSAMTGNSHNTIDCFITHEGLKKYFLVRPSVGCYLSMCHNSTPNCIVRRCCRFVYWDNNLLLNTSSLCQPTCHCLPSTVLLKKIFERSSKITKSRPINV